MLYIDDVVGSQPAAFTDEERLFKAFQEASTGFAKVGLDGTWLSVNQKLCDMTGYTEAELLGKTFMDITHPDDVQADLDNMHKVMDNKLPINLMEKRYICKDGKIVWVHLTAALIRDQAHQPEYFICIIEDITQKKKTEEALQQRETMLSDFFENGAIGLLFTSPDGTVLKANQAIAELLGYAPEEIIGRSIAEYHVDTHAFEELQQRHLNDEVVKDYEARLRCRDSSIRHVLIHASVYRKNGDFQHTRCFIRDITDYKNAQRQGIESESKLRALFDANIVGIAFSGLDGLVHEANDAYLKMIGYTREELQSRQIHWRKLTPPELHPRDEQAIQDLHQQGFSAPYEKQYIHKQGHRVDSLVGIAFYDKPQQKCVAFYLDITEHNKMQQAMRESEQRFRLMADAAPMLIWMLDADGKGSYYNKRWLEYTGCSREEDIAYGWIELLHPDDRATCVDICTQSNVQQEAFTMEFRLRGADGTYRWFYNTATPRLSEQGEFTGFIGSCVDITERRNAEQALRESQERFGLGLMSSNDGLYDWNLLTNDVFWSDRYYEMLGLSRESFQPTYQTFQELIHPDDLESVMTQVHEHLQSRDKYTMDYRIRKSDGDYLHILCRGCAIYNEAGMPVRMLGLIRDITEQKQIERALIASEERYHTLYNWERTTREAIQRIRQPFQTIDELFTYAVDTIGTILKADRCFMYLTRPNKERYVSNEYRSSETLKPLLGFTPKEGSCPYFEKCNEFQFNAIEDVLNDGVLDHGPEWYSIAEEMKIRGFVGIPIHYNQELLSAMFIHTHEPRQWQENEFNFVQTVADQLAITLYQLKIQEELERASRLKSQFVSNISHELRTPLNSIIGYSEMAITGLAGPLNDKQYKYIYNVVTSGKHLLSLVNDVLDLHKVEAGKLTLAMERIDIRKMMADLLLVTQELALKKRVTVSFEIAPALHEFEADPLRMKQVLLNLLSNSIKFNKDQGTVSVKWWTVPQKTGVQLFCQVMDTGVGISKKNIEQLFAEFYQVDSSLARQHEGTGLGLALSKRLIELHGGTISVESQESIGSTFTIRLPQGTSSLI